MAKLNRSTDTYKSKIYHSSLYGRHMPVLIYLWSLKFSETTPVYDQTLNATTSNKRLFARISFRLHHCALKTAHRLKVLIYIALYFQTIFRGDRRSITENCFVRKESTRLRFIQLRPISRSYFAVCRFTPLHFAFLFTFYLSANENRVQVECKAQCDKM